MSETVIKCESVYKIFGENAKKMLEESNGNVDAKTFQENGCIVGVNNASFEVSKGEMLVVMGLSGSCLLYTSPSPRDMRRSRMPSSA